MVFPVKLIFYFPAAPGDPGELALRELLDSAKEVGTQAGGDHGDRILDSASHITGLTDKLSDMRAGWG